MRWWHSIEWPDGTVTPGHKSVESLTTEWDQLELPDLAGQTVLDVGANDGWFSFQAERAGAARVVALDTWEATGYCQSSRGFDLAHSAFHSRVEAVQADFMTADLDALGTFDVVLFLGVLYHLRHPLLGLERLRRVTGGAAWIETEVVGFGEDRRALCEFVEDDSYSHDPTNWWLPSETAVHGLCRAAGFSQVATLVAPRPVGHCRSAFRVAP